MNLELTNKQYATLVKSLAISNWVLSTISEDEEASMEDDFSLEEFEELEQHILSSYKEFGADEMVFFDPDEVEYFSNQEVEATILPILENYEDYVFWDELTHRLSRRDLNEEYGEKKINEMDPLHRMEIEEELIIKYAEEFSRNDVNKLRIQS